MEDHIIKLPEVIRRTGLSDASIFRYEKAGKFPKRRNLGGRAVGWLASEVDSWIAAQSSSTDNLQLAQAERGGRHE